MLRNILQPNPSHAIVNIIINISFVQAKLFFIHSHFTSSALSVHEQLKCFSRGLVSEREKLWGLRDSLFWDDANSWRYKDIIFNKIPSNKFSFYCARKSKFWFKRQNVALKNWLKTTLFPYFWSMSLADLVSLVCAGPQEYEYLLILTQ